MKQTGPFVLRLFAILAILFQVIHLPVQAQPLAAPEGKAVQPILPVTQEANPQPARESLLTEPRQLLAPAVEVQPAEIPLEFRFLRQFGLTGEPYPAADWNEHIDQPFGLAIDGADNLYTVEQSGKRLLTFDASGDLLAASGMQGSSDPLYGPRDVALVDGRLWVPDWHHLAIFEPDASLFANLFEYTDLDGNPAGFDCAGGLWFDADTERLFVVQSCPSNVIVLHVAGIGTGEYSLTQLVKIDGAGGPGSMNWPESVVYTDNALYIGEGNGINRCTETMPGNNDWSCNLWVNNIGDVNGLGVNPAEPDMLYAAINGWSGPQILRCDSGGNCQPVIQNCNDAPAAPFNVQASDGAYSNQVQISWQHVAARDNGSADYQVYRSAGPDAPKFLVGSTMSSSLFDNSPDVNQSTYWVTAFAGGCLSQFGAPDTGIAASMPAPAPAGPPSGLFATQDLPDMVRITWNAAPGAAYYQVGRSLATETTPNYQVTSNSAFLYAIDSPVSGNNNYYVRACSSEGACSDYSLPVVGTAPAYVPFQTPMNFQATWGNFNDRVQLSWPVPDPTPDHYRIWRAPLGTGDFQLIESAIPGNNNQWDDFSVIPGSRYWYFQDTCHTGPICQSTGMTTEGYADWPYPNSLLDNPQDVAIDSFGNIIVSDSGAALIKKFAPPFYNSYQEVAGTAYEPYLTDESYLYRPAGIAIGPDSHVYITEQDGQRLIHFDEQGQPVWSFGVPGSSSNDDGHLNRAQGNPTIDALGRIYIPDTDNNRVAVLNPDGSFLTWIGQQGTGGDQRYYLDSPIGMSISPSGQIFVADNNRHVVKIFNSDRFYLGQIGSDYNWGSNDDQFNQPRGVAVFDDTLVYVVDSNNHRVQRCTRIAADSQDWGCSTFAGMTGEQGGDDTHLAAPSGVAVDAAGRVYVSDQWNNRVQVFSAAGDYLSTIPQDGPWGQIWNPQAVAVDAHGSVYVTDTDGQRVLQFAPFAATEAQISQVDITDPTYPQTITSQVDGVRYALAADSLPEAAILTHTPLSNSVLPPFAGLIAAGPAFEVRVFSSLSYLPLEPAAGTLTLTAPYNPAAGVVGLYYWEPAGGWVKEPTAELDEVNHILSVTPNHLSMWAVLAAPADPANLAPINVSLSAGTVAENTPSGSLVAALTATDPNLTDTFTFSLVSGDGSQDNAAFNVVDSQLRTAQALDYETQRVYHIRLQAADAGELGVEKALTVWVLPVNEAPTALTLSGTRVVAGWAAGTQVGVISVQDPDLGDSHSFTLSGADNALFFLDGRILRTNAYDEFQVAGARYVITIDAEDTDGLSVSQAFSVSVAALREPDAEMKNGSLPPGFELVDTFGLPDESFLPTEPGEYLAGLDSLIVNTDDAVWVTEQDAGRLLGLPSDFPTTPAIAEVAYGNSDAKLAHDQNGNIWQLIDGQGIAIYDASGEYLQTWTNNMQNWGCLRGIALEETSDTTGRVFISQECNTNQVQVYNYTFDEGEYLFTFFINVSWGFNQPSLLTFGGGWLYALDSMNNGRSQVIACQYFEFMPGYGNYVCHPLPEPQDGLNCPNGLTFYDGSLYVSDGCHSDIRRYNIAGDAWNQNAILQELNDPRGLGFSSNGDLFFASSNQAVIYRAARNGNVWDEPEIFAGTLDAPYLADDSHFFQPSGVGVNASGEILITEDTGRRIDLLDAGGAPLWTLGVAGLRGDDDQHFQRPAGNPAFDAEGRIYVADSESQRVTILDPSGSHILGFIGRHNWDWRYQIDRPSAVAIGPDGAIFIADENWNNVKIYDSERNYLGTISAGLNRPRGLAVAPDRRLFIADSDNSRILACDVTGPDYSNWSCNQFVGNNDDNRTSLNQPMGLAVDPDGRLYVADSNNNRVQVYEANGAYLTSIGGNSGYSNSLLERPTGVALDEAGNVYVADHNRHVVRRFAPVVAPDQFVSTLGGQMNDTFRDGNRLYVLQGAQLLVFDVSSPALPVLLGHSSYLNGQIMRVVAAGARAYISMNGEGLAILDVSDPANIVETERCQFPNMPFNSLVLSGDLLLAAYNGMSNGMAAFNLADPAGVCASQQSISLTSGVNDIAVDAAGQEAYLATNSVSDPMGSSYGYLRVLDLSEFPPVEDRAYAFNESLGQVAFDAGQQIVYTAGMGNNLYAIDPTELTTGDYLLGTAMAGAQNALEVDDNYLYAVNGGGVNLYGKFGTPQFGNQKGFWNANSGIRGIALQGSYFHAITDQAGLNTLHLVPDLNSVDLIRVNRFSNPPANPQTIVTDAGLSYILTGGNRIEIYDTARPGQVVFLGSINPSTGINQIDDYTVSKQGDRVLLYAVGNDCSQTMGSCPTTIFSFDVTAPQAPVELGKVNLTGGTRAFIKVQLAGDHYYAYVASSPYSYWNGTMLMQVQGSLFTVEVTDPALMATVGTLDSIYSNYLRGMALSGLYLFVNTDPGMFGPAAIAAYDLSVPTAPVAVTVPLPGGFMPQGVSAVPGRVLVYEGGHVVMYDTSALPADWNLNNHHWEYWLPGGVSFASMEQTEGHLIAQFLLDGWRLYTLDLTLPEDVIQLRNVYLPFNVAGMAVQGNMVHLINQQAGLTTLMGAPVIQKPADNNDTLQFSADNTILSFGAASLPSAATVLHAPLYSANLPPAGNPELISVERAFYLQALDAQTDRPLVLNADYSLVVDTTGLDLNGSSESILKLYWWNELAQTWVAEPTEVDLLNHTLTAHPDHFSLWRVFGATDTEEPTGSLDIDSGAAYTTGLAVNLSLAVVDDYSPQGEIEMRLMNSGETWSAWQAFAASKAWTLSAGANGERTVLVQYRDAAGNLSEPYGDQIVVDTADPGGTISINSGAAFTNTATVTLALTMMDASPVTMSFSNDNLTFSTPEAFAGSKAWTIEAALDGAKTVYMKLADAAGNEALFSDSISLDRAGPAPISITIDAGDMTRNAAVGLSLAASDALSDVVEMRLANEPAFSAIAWQPFAQALASWPLTAGEGTKTIYAQFKDGAGNLSLVVTDSIILDSLAPSGTLLIASGATYTQSAAVTLTINGQGTGTGVTDMQITNTDIFPELWESYNASRTWNLTPGDGPKTVTIRLRDAAGNISANFSAAILLDTTLPGGSLLINNDEPATNQLSVNLLLGAADAAPVSQMKVYNEGLPGSWQPYAFNLAGWSLTAAGPDAARVVNVIYRDAAGNESQAYPDSILLDRTAPISEGVGVLINSGAGFTTSSLVWLNLSAKDNLSGVTHMQLSNDSAFTDAIWEPYDAYEDFALSAGAGSKTVYARFKDAAGNISAVFTDTITVESGYSFDLAPATASGEGTSAVEVSYTLQIHNTGLHADVYTVALSGNAWPVSIPGSQVSLSAGATTNLLVKVTIPGGRLNGATDSVQVKVTSTGDATRVLNTTLTTTSRNRYAVTTSAALLAQTGKAGTALTYTIQIANDGNAPDSIVITKSSAAWITELSAVSTGELLPNQSAYTLNVTVFIPASALQASAESVNLTFASAHDPTQTTSLTLTTTTTSDKIKVYLPAIRRP